MLERAVYLSGPISGCTERQAAGWREYVAAHLAAGIRVVDPMRDAVDFSVLGDEHLDDAGRLRNMMHGREILGRNRTDILRCDLLLANFLGAHRVSIGAIGEIFLAEAFRKPVIIVREPQGNLHDHGLINAITCGLFESLDLAIDKINRMLR
jgi:hypothetical protein